MLQDVLADRKTGGRTTGEQRMNGAPKERASLARVMGYVEQVGVSPSGPLTLLDRLPVQAAARCVSELGAYLEILLRQPMVLCCVLP